MQSISELANEIINGKGYILLPNLLSVAEAQQARDRVLHIAHQQRQAGTLNQQGAKERIYGLIYQGEIFENMVQHPQVLSVIEAILGSEIILGGFSAHILHPGATRMGVHVDYPYWAMPSPFPTYPILEVQVIWLVEDFTEDNGAPLFFPGSQKLATQPDITKFEKLAQKLIGKAGSAILSHGLCWHDTSVNRTPNPRVAILGNYTPKFIHPLEDPLYKSRQQVLDRASPQLRKMLRHALKSSEEPIFSL